MTFSLLVLLISADLPQAAPEIHFENRVRPLLVEMCGKCHGPTKQNGGLRLDSRANALRGGDSGPALVERRPEESLLIKAVRRHPDVSAMPPTAPLSAAQVAALEEWIRNGAVWPEKSAGRVGLGDVEAIKAAAKNHWALQPVREGRPPGVKATQWPSTSIDAFLLGKMESAGLSPSGDADRRVLIRRVTFDLIGLPPSAEESDAFAADPDPTSLAFNKVVDRLLASPQYGERWGRHWLDVARYADTKGYVFQEERRYPFSYTYRDWIVRAFNEDLPFDRFVVQQIAADRLKTKEPRDLAAMGFLTVGRRFLQDIQEITDDRIDVVTRGFLGLTVSCARCHDHKYDPISMSDYYGLYGVFASSEEPKELPLLSDATSSPERADFDRKMKEKAGAVQKHLDDQHAVVERRLIEDSGKLMRITLNSAPGMAPEAARKEGISPGAMRRWSERWNQKVADAKKTHDPALAAWVSLSAIGEKEFAAKAPDVVKRLKSDAKKPLAPELVKSMENPLKNRGELAAVYERFIREAAKSPRAAADHPSLFGPAGAFRVPRAEVQQFLDRKQREKAKELERGVEELKVKHPGAEARAMVMTDRAQPVQAHVFLRGNPGRQGPATSRALPVVLTKGVRDPFKEGSGRRELAEAIVKPDNPLTARVFVNRVWQWRFGKGLAASPSDFGLRSDPPSHPELLDHLAHRFASEGWSVKKLHGWMVHSHAYQMASDAEPRPGDPDNRLLTRFPRLRLEWEALRDSTLAAGGILDTTVGGRPVPLFDGKDVRRRTLYGFVDRQNLDGPFRTFDFATPDATSPQRFVTTVPQQGLFMLNSPFLVRSAEGLASRSNETDVATRVDRVYRFALSRPPSADETDRAVAFLKGQPDWTSDPSRVWTRFAQALLMSNEFAFVD